MKMGKRTLRNKHRKEKAKREQDRIDRDKKKAEVLADPDIDDQEKHRWAACKGKRRYNKEMEAISVCINASAKRGTPLRYYKCDLCGGWHITSKQKKDDTKDK